MCPNLLWQDQFARRTFPRLWIDSKKCNFFVKAAENYHRHYKEKLNIYTDEPVHDRSSDAMDPLAIIQNKRRNKGMTEEDADKGYDSEQTHIDVLSHEVFSLIARKRNTKGYKI